LLFASAAAAALLLDAEAADKTSEGDFSAIMLLHT
jgi:hypothetical protein